MRVWIDLSNSPHPLLFAPIAEKLRARGCEVLATARDNAQTVELARRYLGRIEIVGAESPAGRIGKARALAGRIAVLRRWGARAQPGVALSHNSYAQVVAARLLRVPAVTAMDFEHQPANHLAFRLADTVLLPEAFPHAIARKQGARAPKVVRYPGLKEEIYLGEFNPDPGIVERLGLPTGSGDPLVVVRTPPTRAIYHRRDSRLFAAVLARIARQSARCVVLTRHPEQRAALATAVPSPSDVVLPTDAIDARSLMYAADLVVGAGGTMTREAALIQVPTISVFAGRAPAVDLLLERRGLLRRISDPNDLGSIEPRRHPPPPTEQLRDQGDRLAALFCEATVAAARRG